MNRKTKGIIELIIGAGFLLAGVCVVGLIRYLFHAQYRVPNLLAGLGDIFTPLLAMIAIFFLGGLIIFLAGLCDLRFTMRGQHGIRPATP